MRGLARPTEAQPLDRLLAGSRGEGAAARGAAFYETRLQSAAAMLATPFIMLLLAVPAAFGLPRQGGGAARRAAVGLALGLGYLLAAGLLGALGEAGALPPVLAAWRRRSSSPPRARCCCNGKKGDAPTARPPRR
jgi:lipopolysaccharide export system permease protein